MTRLLFNVIKENRALLLKCFACEINFILWIPFISHIELCKKLTPLLLLTARKIGFPHFLIWTLEATDVGPDVSDVVAWESQWPCLDWLRVVNFETN